MTRSRAWHNVRCWASLGDPAEGSSILPYQHRANWASRPSRIEAVHYTKRYALILSRKSAEKRYLVSRTVRNTEVLFRNLHCIIWGRPRKPALRGFIQTVAVDCSPELKFQTSGLSARLGSSISFDPHWPHYLNDQEIAQLRREPLVPSVPPAQNPSITRSPGGTTKLLTWKVQEVPMHPRIAALTLGFGSLDTRLGQLRASILPRCSISTYSCIDIVRREVVNE
ncbi:uncharacterized protein M421DRAFT_164838 [Didymella exigua CBS 183.55]|uniref:Uncharacterized protein n=1 Tax=Didymella exigua CBS 183.55 TaxID=1150837 RepID=A0A6A5RR53_9PLEO|nr:uncharacterized protein M421DRAFT_164838 [Didymella exigua CBS 183.55]KAF1927967.1 hypothetical protein M421DRAFT_164838 [Didymella exigua CBS 183.55]